VVVNCAGEGRRLGLGKTKALVSVLGQPLISWHLRMLRDVDDVVVVVGHQAEDVIDVVSGSRPDAVFAFNHDYSTTGTAASLVLGAHGAPGDIISLDGDLLVHPEDFRGFVESRDPCLGVAPANTTDAVIAHVEDRSGAPAVTSFSRQGPGLEWTGLLRIPSRVLHEARGDATAHGHVYELLTPHLPLAGRHVRAREIDTPDDYDRAVEWIEPIAHCWGP
jgi:choline kinase